MKLFVDSGIFVEYLKGRRIDFYEYLIQQDYELFINQIVLSEFLYYYIGIIGNKSPMAIKESGIIGDCLAKQNPLEMISGIKTLGHNAAISQSAIDIMKNHNLLANDALILATCQHFEIKYLATFDSDFEKPCSALGIRIFNDKDDFKNFIPNF